FKTDPTATPWFLAPTPSGSAPTVTASASATSGSSGLTVNFSASATVAGALVAGGATISQYIWTFDDGDFAYGATPTKPFYAPGPYNVQLAVIDSNGDVILDPIAITINGDGGPTPPPYPPPYPPPPPPPKFSAIGTTPSNGGYSVPLARMNG